MTTQDIAAIAGKLTRAQQKGLEIYADNWLTDAHADMRTLSALDRRGLTARYVSNRDFREARVTLTPLGTAVRSYLANHIDGKDRV